MTRQLTSQQMSQALQFRNEGYSIRDIAAELGVPKSQIEKLLNQQPRSSLELTNPLSEQSPNLLPVPSQELTEREQRLTQLQTTLEADRQALNQKAQILADQEQQILSRSNLFAVTTREHGRQLVQLAEREQSLAQERIALEDRYTEVQRLLQSMPEKEEQYEIFRKRARQDKLVSRYNRLLQEVLDNCDDCRWSGDEVDEFLEQAESIKDKVVSFCTAHQLDERRLLIYQGLVFIIGEVEEEQEEQTTGLFSGSSVDFDYSPEYQARIKSFMVQTFDQDAPVSSPSVDSGVQIAADTEDDDWGGDDDE